MYRVNETGDSFATSLISHLTHQSFRNPCRKSQQKRVSFSSIVDVLKKKSLIKNKKEISSIMGIIKKTVF